MKKACLLTLLTLTVTIELFAQVQQGGVKVKDYKNTKYKFVVSVPNNWKLYGEEQNKSVNDMAIVDWELPAVYSELEKTNIANSISVTAYKHPLIRSVGDLIKVEIAKTPCKTEIAKDNVNALIIYPIMNGLQYKGKLVFVFKDGIGYIINFMATPGTFDKNLPVFEAFNNSVRFK